jgi:hypothetical protein
MATPEITRMIKIALSGGRSLRDIEDYLDWLENTARESSVAEVKSGRVSPTPLAPIVLDTSLTDPSVACPNQRG